MDWTTALGAPFTVVASPFNVTSASGNTLSISQPGNGSFERRDEGNGWAGNFAPRDELLWNQDNTGTISIKFLNPVGGLGANIERDLFGAFVGTLTVFDTGGGLIGSVSENGNGVPTEDGTAIFLGANSTVPIGTAVFTVDGGQNGFAINELSLGAAAVPEPGALAMLVGLAVTGVSFKLRRRPAKRA